MRLPPRKTGIDWGKQVRQLLRFIGLLRRPKTQLPLPPPDVPPAPVETPPAPTVPRPTDLRGQFVIYTTNPWHGDSRFPRALPDRFFMAELDAVWDQKPEEAERILVEYKALGCNHVTVGTPLDRGYHGHYPDMDWLNRPERYAEFLRWLLAHGVEFSLFVLPDTPEFLDGTEQVRWDTVEAQLTPFYARLVELVEVRRVVSGWEWYTRGADMVHVFAYLTRIFPNAERLWHNPVGHLSPCHGTEYESGGMTSPEAWRAVAAAGCTGLGYQAWPQNMTIPDTDRDHLSMLAYDISDMRRRFTGDNSPWGAAITTPDGTPLAVEYMEGCAYAQYWTDTARDIGPAWRRVALEAGARYALDGALR